VPVGTLVTLSLPPDSPVAELPWVITVGALGDDEDWEPVVCGPYERAHALALAQAVVADEDLMAVVEPLLPLVDAEAIRDEVETVRVASLQAAQIGSADLPDGSDSAGQPHGSDSDDVPDGSGPAGFPDGPDSPDLLADERIEPGPAPTATEVRAGFARLAAKLPGMAR
jgi:hypothetical protein